MITEIDKKLFVCLGLGWGDEVWNGQGVELGRRGKIQKEKTHCGDF